VELATRSLAVESPVDFDAGAVHPAIPCASFSPQYRQIRDSLPAEALTREQSDFDFE